MTGIMPHGPNGGALALQVQEHTDPVPPKPVSAMPSTTTDAANAERLVSFYGADLRYCHPFGTWFEWDERRWQRDETGCALRYARMTARLIYQQAAEVAVSEPGESGAEKAKSLAQWARQSEQRSRLDAMEYLARSADGIPVLPEQLDADPWLFNCANGTIDLRTGRRRDCSRNDLITQLSPAEYHPEATCPEWEQFLETILPSEEVRRYVQRAAGYSMTGDTSERVLFLLHGKGRNGKSTLVNTLRTVYGDYGTRTPTETLMARRGDPGIPNDLARLRAARYVCASETEKGRRLAESLVKDICGGEPICARFLRCEWFEFRPQFKVWLSTNHLPIIVGGDDAIWDRLPLIPFEIRIPENEIIPQRELEARFAAERDGILAWCVRGCQDWLEHGLMPPDAVHRATTEYRQEMDTISQFLADCCLLETEFSESAKTLYERYQQWCSENTGHAHSQRAFGRELAQRGYERYTSNGTRYRGIAVRTGANDAA